VAQVPAGEREEDPEALSTVAVVGPGAIGGVLAWQASRAGHDVHLCVRTPFGELVITHGGETHAVPTTVHTDPGSVPAADWVLVATKSHQTAGAAPWLRSLLGPGTRAVVGCQNGVEQEQGLAPIAGGTPVLPVVVMIGAEALAPGRIRHATAMQLQVPDSGLGRELRDLFAGSDLDVVPTPDFTTARWRKLAMNVAANSLTALTGRRIAELARPDVVDLGIALVAECVTVARAEGADLPDDLGAQVVGRWGQVPRDVGSSMLYDRLAGRPLEHDAITGAVLRAAARHGIDTPATRWVHGLLDALAPTG
jgi:2-dehydropantoate 2-reductase